MYITCNLERLKWIHAIFYALIVNPFDWLPDSVSSTPKMVKNWIVDRYTARDFTVFTYSWIMYLLFTEKNMPYQCSFNDYFSMNLMVYSTANKKSQISRFETNVPRQKIKLCLGMPLIAIPAFTVFSSLILNL